MTPEEHYAEAERLLYSLDGVDQVDLHGCLERAKIHALLANHRPRIVHDLGGGSAGSFKPSGPGTQRWVPADENTI